MRTFLHRFALLALALIIVLFTLVQFQQHLLRYRAKRLHAEILALQLHPGSFADLQRVQREWGAHARYEGTCNQYHCDYEILLQDFATSLHTQAEPNAKLAFQWSMAVNDIAPPLMRLYRILGGRPVAAVASIRVHDNHVWAAEFGLLLWAYPGQGRNEGHPYVVLAAVNSRPHILTTHQFNAGTLEQGYRTDHTLQCAGCEMAYANINSQTSVGDIRLFNQFNFACITQIKTCRDPVELAPALWKVAINDTVSDSRDEDDTSFCRLSTPVLAREADDVLLVQVLDTHNLHYPNTSKEGQRGTVRVLSALKNGRDTPIGTTFEYSNPAMAVRLTESGQTTFVAGQQYFFLYRHPQPNEVDTWVGLRPCHGLLNTPVNAAEVRKGIALDPSAGELNDRD